MTSTLPRPLNLSFSLLKSRQGVKRFYFCHLSISQRTIVSMERPTRPRRFAPLDPVKRKEGDKRPPLKGIVFDVDGTLCEFMLYVSAPSLANADEGLSARHCPYRNKAFARHSMFFLSPVQNRTRYNIF
jgi:hypothetical protein